MHARTRCTLRARRWDESDECVFWRAQKQTKPEILHCCEDLKVLTLTLTLTRTLTLTAHPSPHPNPNPNPSPNPPNPDRKVLGKREFRTLLTWRLKMAALWAKEQTKHAAEGGEEGEGEEEEAVDPAAQEQARFEQELEP